MKQGNPSEVGNAGDNIEQNNSKEMIEEALKTNLEQFIESGKTVEIAENADSMQDLKDEEYAGQNKIENLKPENEDSNPLIKDVSRENLEKLMENNKIEVVEKAGRVESKSENASSIIENTASEHENAEIMQKDLIHEAQRANLEEFIENNKAQDIENAGFPLQSENANAGAEPNEWKGNRTLEHSSDSTIANANLEPINLKNAKSATNPEAEHPNSTTLYADLESVDQGKEYTIKKNNNSISETPKPERLQENSDDIKPETAYVLSEIKSAIPNEESTNTGKIISPKVNTIMESAKPEILHMNPEGIKSENAYKFYGTKAAIPKEKNKEKSISSKDSKNEGSEDEETGEIILWKSLKDRVKHTQNPIHAPSVRLQFGRANLQSRHGNTSNQRKTMLETETSPKRHAVPTALKTPTFPGPEYNIWESDMANSLSMIRARMQAEQHAKSADQKKEEIQDKAKHEGKIQAGKF